MRGTMLHAGRYLSIDTAPLKHRWWCKDRAEGNSGRDMPERIELSATVGESEAGERLDQAAARLFPDYSRARLQGWIKAGELRVGGEQRRPRDRVAAGEVLTVQRAAFVAEALIYGDPDMAPLTQTLEEVEFELRENLGCVALRLLEQAALAHTREPRRLEPAHHVPLKNRAIKWSSPDL